MASGTQATALPSLGFAEEEEEEEGYCWWTGALLTF